MLDSVFEGLIRLTDDVLGLAVLAWIVSVVGALPFLLDLRIKDKLRGFTNSRRRNLAAGR